MEPQMIGSKIAKARKERNMSQAQLAQLLFISPQAVGKWERGESIPDIITFNRLAEILGVDLNYFSENYPSAHHPAMPGIPVDLHSTHGQPLEEFFAPPAKPDPQGLTNFSGSNLPGSDFTGITAHKRKFRGSALRDSDFSGADLTGSSFAGSDVTNAKFDGTNLTDCTLSALALTNASFHKSILVRTEFSKAGLVGATFTDVNLIDVKLTMTDLTKTNFINCIFNGVDFTYSDLRGLCLDGQTFTGVKFNKAALNETSFKGATLKNVSFRSPYALTNKYYRALKTIHFDGARMDKLTYAALKGIGADVSKATFI